MTHRAILAVPTAPNGLWLVLRTSPKRSRPTWAPDATEGKQQALFVRVFANLFKIKKIKLKNITGGKKIMLHRQCYQV